MSILAWIVLGLVAGFIASKLVNRSGGSLVLDLVLGVVGAFVGGFLFTRFGAAGVTGLNIYSILVATLGAVVVLFIYHALSGRRVLERCAPGIRRKAPRLAETRGFLPPEAQLTFRVRSTRRSGMNQIAATRT